MDTIPPPSTRSSYTPFVFHAPTVTGSIKLAIIEYLTRWAFIARYFWWSAGMTALRDFPLADTDATALPIVIPSPSDYTLAATNSTTLSSFDNRFSSLDVSLPLPFRFWCVTDYWSAYKSNKVTPSQVIVAVLNCVEAYQRENRDSAVFVHVNKLEILELAEASSGRWRNGKPLSLLDGIPVVVKDELDVQGFPAAGFGTSFFSQTRRKEVEDSFCIKQLKLAGCIIVAKTTMSEVGMNITNCNPITGTPRNPWNSAHYTGGSSGGSAAAVGSGLVPVAIGADGGGSVRIPSSFCGLWGLKPTWGRVFGHPSPNLSASTGHVGPLASTLEGAVLCYIAMAQSRDPNNALTNLPPNVSIPKYLAFKSPMDLRGVRIGIFREFNNHADTHVVKACNNVVDYLTEFAGMHVVDIAIPDLELIRIALTISIISDVAGLIKTQCPDHTAELSYPTQILLNLQKHATVLDLTKSQRMRTKAMDTMRQIFTDQCDIVILPSTPVVAPRVPVEALSAGISDSVFTLIGTRFAFLANVTGIPALSCPVGFHDGLPIGCQVMGKWWDEDIVLTVGRAIDGYVKNHQFSCHAKGGRVNKPQVWFDVLCRCGI